MGGGLPARRDDEAGRVLPWVPPRLTGPQPRRWPERSLLGSLPRSAADLLLGLGGRRRYPEGGEILVREGDRTTFVVVLVSGLVKVTGATPQGGALLAIRAAGDLVGELSALDGRPRSATVTTATPVLAVVAKQSEFLALWSRHPAISLAVGRSIAEKLRVVTSRRIALASCDIRTRVAWVLLEVAEHYGVSTPTGSVRVPLNQAELGALANASEVSVNRVIARLKRDGIVQAGYREIIIVSAAALREAARPLTIRGGE